MAEDLMTIKYFGIEGIEWGISPITDISSLYWSVRLTEEAEVWVTLNTIYGLCQNESFTGNFLA